MRTDNMYNPKDQLTDAAQKGWEVDYAKFESELKPRLTEEFLETLVEAMRLWSSENEAECCRDPDDTLYEFTQYCLELGGQTILRDLSAKMSVLNSVGYVRNVIK